MQRVILLAASCSVILWASGASAQSISSSLEPISITGINPGNLDDNGQPVVDDNGIQYHGTDGSLTHVMAVDPNAPYAVLYYIYYGDSTQWDPAGSAVTILEDWANNIGGSAYANILTSYCNAHNCAIAGTPINNATYYGGGAYDAYSRGTNLNQAAIINIVRDAISSGAFGSTDPDPTGSYLVVTSQDVSMSGFCTSFCAWHSYTTISSVGTKYGYVGDPMHCSATQCMRQRNASPNDDPSSDGMINLIAHELEETISDPDTQRGWYGPGGENEDKCAWTFGSTFTEPNGSIANMTLGARDYLIQRNWVNDFGGYCDLSY